MQISVDIKKLRDHSLLLQEELREAEAFRSFLQEWRARAISTGTDDIAFIDKHISVVGQQIGKIKRRAEQIESMSEKFSFLAEDISNKLDDAATRLKYIAERS